MHRYHTTYDIITTPKSNPNQTNPFSSPSLPPNSNRRPSEDFCPRTSINFSTYTAKPQFHKISTICSGHDRDVKVSMLL